MANHEVFEADITSLLKADHHQQIATLEEPERATVFCDAVVLKTSRYGHWRAAIIGACSVLGGLGAVYQINHLLTTLEDAPFLAHVSQLSPMATLGLVLVMFIIGMAAWSQPSRH